MRCKLVKNDHQNTSKVLFSFVPNKQFGELINISPHSLTMMNTVNTEFCYVGVWFADQASKALKIEDNVEFDTNNWVHIIKMRYSTEPRFRKYVKRYGEKFGDKYEKKWILQQKQE